MVALRFPQAIMHLLHQIQTSTNVSQVIKKPQNEVVLSTTLSAFGSKSLGRDPCRLLL